jgi:hypothetical protein
MDSVPLENDIKLFTRNVGETHTQLRRVGISTNLARYFASVILSFDAVQFGRQPFQSPLMHIRSKQPQVLLLSWLCFRRRPTSRCSLSKHAFPHATPCAKDALNL